MRQVEAEHYAERVRVEAEAYGIGEDTIRELDAAGIPWRRFVGQTINERIARRTEPPR
jgi:hypothetical protein